MCFSEYMWHVKYQWAYLINNWQPRLPYLVLLSLEALAVIAGTLREIIIAIIWKFSRPMASIDVSLHIRLSLWIWEIVSYLGIENWVITLIHTANQIHFYGTTITVFTPLRRSIKPCAYLQASSSVPPCSSLSQNTIPHLWSKFELVILYFKTPRLRAS